MAYTQLYMHRDEDSMDYGFTFTTLNDVTPIIVIPDHYRLHGIVTFRSGATNYTVRLDGSQFSDMSSSTNGLTSFTQASPSTNGAGTLKPWQYFRFQLTSLPSAQTITVWLGLRARK